MIKTYDFSIIGGGFQGLLLAYKLSKTYKVAIIEQADTMSKSARRRIEGILAYQTILNWDNIPIRIVLTAIIKVGMYFRKIMRTLKYNLKL